MALVRPVAIGPLRLARNLVLAPLHHLTYAAMRMLCRAQGAALAHTTMVTPEELLYSDDRGRRTLASPPGDRPLGVQLLPRHPQELAETVCRLREAGAADLVDLNLACPSRKMLRTERGGAMLRDPDRVRILVEAAVRAAVPLPVTVKCRLGVTDSAADLALGLETARAAVGAGAVGVTVHGRTVQQGYRGSADWAAIGRWAAALPVPVLASGDLLRPEAVLAALQETGCEAAYVARGALGAPWIFRQVLELAETGRATPVTMAERRGTVLAHFDGLARQFGECRAAVLMRTMACYYTRGIPGAKEARAAVFRATCAAHFRMIVARHFAPATGTLTPPPPAG